MIDHGVVRSTVKPDKLVVDENSVWIAKDVEFITEDTGEETFVGFQFTLMQYTKDEYIVLTDIKREEDKTQTDLALAEIAEMLLGGAV